MENSTANFILPEIDQKRCILCGKCVDICTEKVLILNEDRILFDKPEACIFCASCEAVCPENAIRCAYEIVWNKYKEIT